MSIINDALKKTQDNLQNNQPPAPPAQDQLPNPPANENTPKPPQPPNVPDMSKFIPVKEKPVNVPPPPDVADPKRKKELKKNLVKTESDKTPENPAKIFFSIILSLLILGAAGLIAYMNFPVLSGKKKNSIKPQDLKREISKAVESIPIPESIKEITKTEKKNNPPPPPPPGVLIANGIVSMGDHQVALINNNIYEIGDTVDGWTITAISLDQVEIKNGEQTKVLKVQK